MLNCLLRVAVISTTLALASCGCKAEKPACSPERLAQIEVNFVNEALERCKGYSYDNCPVLPEIRAKYRAQREEWVSCR